MINNLLLKSPKELWAEREAPCLLYFLKLVRSRWGRELDSPVWKVGITRQSIKNRFDRFSGPARIIEQSEQFDEFAVVVMESWELATVCESIFKRAFKDHRFYKNGCDPASLLLLETGNSELFTLDPVEWFASRNGRLTWERRILSESNKNLRVKRYSARPKPAPVKVAPKVAPKIQPQREGAVRWVDDKSRDIPSGGTSGDCHNGGRTNWDKSAGRSYGSNRAL